MKTVVGPIVLAIVLLSLALLAYRESRRLGDEAGIHEQMATLRDAGPRNPAADYWRGDYERLQNAGAATTGDPDPELLLIRANAAFRASQRLKQSRQEQGQQLDVVLQAYTTALKAPTFLPDAAYNYEFVARLRDGLSRPPSLPRHSASYGGTGPRHPTRTGASGSSRRRSARRPHDSRPARRAAANDER